MRLDLSSETFIDTMDGVRYLVTTEPEVKIAWTKIESWQRDFRGEWKQYPETIEVVYWREWRIPLTACWDIYRYREGEPGIVLTPLRTWALSPAMAKWARNLTYSLHRRAAIVCDSAEQFRAFYDAIKPTGKGGT